MTTHRGPDGRFACVPTYPRLRTTKCGCAGGVHGPCPIGRRLRPVREKAKRAHRPRPATPAEIEELESELYGVEAERDALAETLESVRAQIRDTGSIHHSSKRTGKRAYSRVDTYGEDSEFGYRQLLEQREQLLAHDRHLKVEQRSLTNALHKLTQAGAARVKVWLGRTTDRGLRRTGVR